MSNPIAAVTDATAPPVALITGGGQRIGAALARVFAAQGFALALSYHHTAGATHDLADRLRRQGVDAQVFHCDLAGRSAGAQLMAQVGRQIGHVSLAICNAASFARDSAAEFDESVFDEVMAINTRAPLSIARAMHETGQENTGLPGLVINILDGKVLAPNPDFLSYTLSKCTLAEATRLTATAFQGRPRVNAIAPGMTLPSPRQPMDRFLRAAAANPMAHIATPDEIADAALMLWQAKQLNGQIIAVDGGQSLLRWDHDVAWYARHGML